MKFLSARFWGVIDSLIAGWILLVLGGSVPIIGIIGIIINLPERILVIILAIGQVIIILGLFWILRRVYLIEHRMLKKGLDIVSALYGLKNVTKDATQYLISEISAGKHEILVGNHLIGDENLLPGQRKELTVFYFRDGKKSSVTVLERDILSIDDLT